jgi:phosphopantetheinyl transferase (holo-ACP synthase)
VLLRSVHGKAYVALATVEELPSAGQIGDPERSASRLAICRAVCGVAEEGRGTIEIRHRSRRLPSVHVHQDGSSARRAFAVSLSHRDGRIAAIAATSRSRVGVDVERCDGVDETHARLFLSASERRAAFDVPLAVLWALKEAAWKALELGDDVAFTDLRLDIDGGVLRGVRIGQGYHRGISAIAHPWPGFVLAVVQLERHR